MKIGITSVKIRNVRERTRSRYSRLATIRILLAMARHSGLDAARADTLDEDLVQRGLHELELLDVRAGVDQAAEQELRVGVGRQLELEVVVGVVALPNERGIPKDLVDSIASASRQHERDVSRTVRVFHRRDAAIQHLLAAR